MKQFLCILLLWCGSMAANADRFTEMAGRHLEWLKTGQADSVLAHATPQVNAQLSAAMVQAIWKQLLTQAGQLEKQEAWSLTERQGLHVCQSVLRFERLPLQMNVVLDNELLLAGLTFTPAPATATQPTTPARAGAEENFTEEDFTVKHGGIELPGTLTLPKDLTKPVPAVVLVQGSGPQDRDETLGPNKPFRELAHALATQGIAVVRYDKRTKVYGARTAEVSGGQLTYDTEVVDDAVQALRQTALLPQVDKQRLFVIGHSLGGTLVPRIAEKADTPLAGIIGWAALTRPFRDALMEQLVYIARKQGADEATAQTQAEATARQIMAAVPKEYVDFQQTYDPTATARQLKDMPMLFLQGGHDYQVTEADLKLWEKALAGRTQVHCVFLPKLDHLLRELPEMATPADYLKEGKMDAEALRQITDFILHNSLSNP